MYYSASLALSRCLGNSLRTGCLFMEMRTWKWCTTVQKWGTTYMCIVHIVFTRQMDSTTTQQKQLLFKRSSGDWTVKRSAQGTVGIHKGVWCILSEVPSCSDHRKIRSARLGWRWPTAQQAGWRPISCSGGPGCPPFDLLCDQCCRLSLQGSMLLGTSCSHSTRAGLCMGRVWPKRRSPSFWLLTLTPLWPLWPPISASTPLPTKSKSEDAGELGILCVCVKCGWFVWVCGLIGGS